MKRVTGSVPILLAASAGLAGPVCAQGNAQEHVTSPERSDSGGVAFRIRAPEARSVRLVSPGDMPNAAFGDGLELVWFSTGRDDFLLDTKEATVAMLRECGFDVEYVESSGGHTWINWRQYPGAFARRLFD